MTDAAPIHMFWDDNSNVLRPADTYWARRAAKRFVAGEIYRIVDEPERSDRSHRHFFASVANAWSSLPPLMAEQFKSPEALRKFALIKAGYCDTKSMPCGSPAAAQKFGAFIRPLDEYALVTVTGSVVYVFRAQSQSYKAMGQRRFAQSKEAVLDVIAEMIGASKDELNSSEPTMLDYAGTP